MSSRGKRPGIALITALAASASLYAQPAIDHAGLECIEPGTFAVVLSGIDPDQEIQTAKVYFRSSLYPDFYYVEMQYQDGRFIGILPQAAPETPQIIYYVEAIDSVFNSARSPEFDPLIEDPCDDKPAAAYLPGDTPGIIVGATTSGASPLPPGFSAVGIAGSITAAGISSGIGGGVGAGAAVAAAAGAAGVAGAVVATSPEAEETTTTVAAAPPPSSPTTSVAPAPGPSTTTTAPPSTTTSSASTTTTSAPASTTTTAPVSTTTSAPPNTTTSAPTTSPSTTTTSSSTGLNPECFTVEVLGECRVRLDASCVNKPVDRYEWVLDVNDRWDREHISSGPESFTYSWDEDDCEDDENIEFRLVVRRGSVSKFANKTVFIKGSDDLRTPTARPARIRFETELVLPESRGRVVLNGSFLRVIQGSEPVLVQTNASEGTNAIEAVVGRSAAEPGHWRFDFRRDAGFARGSLRVDEGSVLSLEPDAVVFRLNGHPGERVRFTFQLEPR